MSEFPWGKTETWFDIEVCERRVGYVARATIHSKAEGLFESDIFNATTSFWRPTKKQALNRARRYTRRRLASEKRSDPQVIHRETTEVV